MIFKTGIILLVVAFLMIAAGSKFWIERKAYCGATLAALVIGGAMVVLSMLILAWEVMP